MTATDAPTKATLAAVRVADAMHRHVPDTQRVSRVMINHTPPRSGWRPRAYTRQEVH